jgi:hypothetical protein
MRAINFAQPQLVSLFKHTKHSELMHAHNRLDDIGEQKNLPFDGIVVFDLHLLLSTLQQPRLKNGRTTVFLVVTVS